MKYSEWIDYQFGKAVMTAVRKNQQGKATIDESAMAIAKANSLARRRMGWLKKNPQFENSYDETNPESVYDANGY